jgi:hypothetical protein
MQIINGTEELKLVRRLEVMHERLDSIHQQLRILTQELTAQARQAREDAQRTRAWSASRRTAGSRIDAFAHDRV